MLALLTTLILVLDVPGLLGHQLFLENAVQEKEEFSADVKVKETTFKCSFWIVHTDGQINIRDSSVKCLPNKPKKKVYRDLNLGSRDGYNFSVSFGINPDKLRDITTVGLTELEISTSTGIQFNEEPDIHYGCSTRDKEASNTRGAAWPGISLWNSAAVPYYFTSSFTYNDRLTFAKAVEAIQAVTCLRFVPRTTQTAFIRIERECACGGSCFGGGYTDGLGVANPRRLVIGSPCLSPSSASGVGLVIHETLHALGVVHTQTRPDRDSYIQVNTGNIQPSGLSQYEKCGNCLTHGTAYDCMSVMHYRDWGFSVGGRPTMSPRYSWCDLKTATNALTATDIKLLNSMYKCTKEPVDGGWSGWSVWSQCSKQCGYGSQYRYRLCNYPTPANGGKDCQGPAREERDCINQACETCALVGKNTQGRTGSAVTPGVGSWAECAELCVLSSTCKAWTWSHENAGAYALNCALMTGYKNFIEDTNTVSGPKECAGCPEKGVNLQGRVGAVLITGVKSWDACAAECKKRSACQAWSWAKESAGAYALRCSVMEGYGSKVADTNTISGSRDCPGAGECSGLAGTADCCSSTNQCEEGGGDCDQDTDCAGSLVCGFNNCRDFNPAAPETNDCCMKSTALCTGDEGTVNCCTDQNPCQLGGGDCDSDSECAGDLVCGTNNCVDFNAAAHPQYDCCVKPKVDGGWSSWGSWTTCTKSRSRTCSNPAPDQGGADCTGSSSETVPCS